MHSCSSSYAQLCLNLFLGSRSLRVERIVCNLQLLPYNCPKAEVGILVYCDLYPAERGLLACLRTRIAGAVQGAGRTGINEASARTPWPAGPAWLTLLTLARIHSCSNTAQPCSLRRCQTLISVPGCLQCSAQPGQGH